MRKKQPDKFHVLQRNYLWLCFICFIIGLTLGGYIGKKRGIPFIRNVGRYSIGIYEGTSPFDLKPPPGIVNPVLTAADVTDVPADFVADPFMVFEDNRWYMFFEVMNNKTKHGDIGLAVSNDGYNWFYKQIVLDEPFHLSYPYIFKWENDYYMIPESNKAYSVRLYKAVSFPIKWSFVQELFSGRFSDSSIFRFDERWWIFTSDGQDVLRLFSADNLTSTWIEHPKSPIILKDANIARPGGRVLLFDGRIFRCTQDCDPTYGNQVRAFEVIELTTESYKENPVPQNPILKGSRNGWNGERMHHIDAHQIDKNNWIACVDGYGKSWVFGFQY